MHGTKLVLRCPRRSRGSGDIQIHVGFEVLYDQRQKHIFFTRSGEVDLLPTFLEVLVEVEIPGDLFTPRNWSTRKFTCFVGLTNVQSHALETQEERRKFEAAIHRVLGGMVPDSWYNWIPVDTLPDTWAALGLSHLLTKAVGGDWNRTLELFMGMFTEQTAAS